MRGELGAGPCLAVSGRPSTQSKSHVMAKGKTILVQLLSTAGTGFFYVTRKNPRTVTRKLAFRKYDPIVRRHVLFTEKKLPSGKKR